MKLNKLILLVLSTFLFFACNIKKQQLSSTDLYSEVDKTWEQYVNAMKTVNVDSVLSFWADDLKIITSANDIDGKEALRDFLTPIYNGLTIHELKSTSTKMNVSDKLAVDVREYSETVSYDGGEMQTSKGKQITVWEKIDDCWKISIVSITPITPDSIHDVFK
jgi:ketosteroid isomerase-like protein